MRRGLSDNPEHVRMLTSPSWSACEERIKAFEEAWRRGTSPQLGDFLCGDGPLRRALLLELVHVELEFRLKAGQVARVELYLDNYPELQEDRAAILGLLTAEYQLRQRFEGHVGLGEFAARFPGYLDDLLERLVGDPAATRIDRHSARARTVGTDTLPRSCWPLLPGYEILAELGRGGMGVVYQARDIHLGRMVALKFLPAEYARDPDRLDRFFREARTASALNHPHICTVHGLGEHEGRPFIVLEYIEGRTLQTLVGTRLGVEALAQLIGQAARALALAHAAGVVHRDVKPDNIMVREDGYVKVLDFGLARRIAALATPGGTPSRDTDPGAFIGTVAYTSPEQARGEPAGPASDVFSLGVVLYQLATGKHPFEADSALEILQAITTRQPAPPSYLDPEVPAALETLILACLQKDPQLRPRAAEVEAALTALAGRGASWPVQPVLAPASASSPRPTVGRRPEREALRVALAEAAAGKGALLCVAGEPGIGKTTLVEDFLDEIKAPGRGGVVGRGRCSERLAGAEAYLPVLEALEGLLRGETGGVIARLMKTVAPTWYAQVAPAAVPSGQASSQQAMKREFTRYLHEVSRLAPLVLFFDDLHWADLSTVDLLAHLGRQLPGTRVLVLATYRPAELLLAAHPFHRVKLELQGAGVCRELVLGLLGREDIDQYLARTFPDHLFPTDFADLIHARTEGNPLFMADLLRYLRERGVIAEAGGRWRLARELPDLRLELPESVRSMIQRQIEQLGEDDRRLLAAAAVQGHEFDSAVVAAALGLDPAEAEERLREAQRVHGLVRLVREHELPDRTLTLRYRFVHVLYQHALQGELPPTRRAALSVGLAQAMERHHGEGVAAVAAELACLYEAGRDLGQAARYLCQAAGNAARVNAHQEAVVLARRGLDLLGSLPPSPERDALELPLQTALGLQLQVTEGFAAPGAEAAYRRALDLSTRSPGGQPPFNVCWGLWLYHKVRSNLGQARAMAGELQALAVQLEDPSLALQAQQALAVTTLCLGEPARTLSHMEQGTALYDCHRHRAHSTRFGQDPGVASKAFGAVALWLLGYPDEAERQSASAVALARDLAQPSSQALALHFAAMLYQCRRDPRRCRECAEASSAIASEQGFSFWLAGALVLRGWALAESGAQTEGVGLLRQGLHAWELTGSVTYRTYYLGLLAEVLLRQGRTAEAGDALDEALALVDTTGEGLHEAELWRLRGELQVRQGQPAEDCFRRALEVARRQEARSLALRAAVSLVRSGSAEPSVLADLYKWFSEGFDTPDLLEARRRLDTVS